LHDLPSLLFVSSLRLLICLTSCTDALTREEHTRTNESTN